MQTKTALLGSALALCVVALPLAGCATDGYGYGYGGGVGVAWVDSPYDVYYDDYYGPIYDGYWGGDGYFYYRSTATSGYHRGDNHHFRHDTGGNTWHRYQGTTHQPPRGTSMPHYPRNGSSNDNNRHHHRSGS